MSDPISRFHWPREGVAIRVPPRRVVAAASVAGAVGRTSCETIAFAGRAAQVARRVAWDALAEALPRGARVVLLVAAEDVSFTTADVPALSGLRLREALPNLVEESTVADVGALHVALGQSTGAGRARTLAVVDRKWLATMQVHVARAGGRVAAIVPAPLAVPLATDAWTIATTEAGRCLRTGSQAAMSLPDDAASAVAIAAAIVRQGTRPARIDEYGAAPGGAGTGAAIAESLGVPLVSHTVDPFGAWLAGQGAEGGYGPPLSLLAFEGAGAWTGGARWRIAALLALAVVAVQIVGMQWQWAGLRGEADALRRQSTALLTTAFPETRVVVDPPLQMARGLAGLRASAGRSDPADFTTMMAATARIFASLPSNALRGADFEARALRLRFAPGNATAADERERFVAAALQEGYVLRFDSAANASGEAQASLQIKGAAS